jgi:predicted GNAT superfamily acetyltransferase
VRATSESIVPGDRATASPLSALELGFAEHDDPRGPDGEALAWTKRSGDRWVTYRVLRHLPDLLPIDGLQREVFGVTDYDLLAAGELLTVQSTGGFVLGAFLGAPGTTEELVGFSVGWGGYVQGRPRIVSDYLAVRADLRSHGLGADLKRLQAVIALDLGFIDIIWTVDPLRAANARLNFEKLGAFADQYEVNRYGETFASGLYGGLPSDRLHVTWPITDPRVHERLLGLTPPLTTADVKNLRHVDPSALTTNRPKRALVYLPSNIDLLVARDPNAALRWRLTLREILQQVFAAGYAIVGFVPDIDLERGYSAYLIERRHARR